MTQYRLFSFLILVCSLSSLHAGKNRHSTFNQYPNACDYDRHIQETKPHDKKDAREERKIENWKKKYKFEKK